MCDCGMKVTYIVYLMCGSTNGTHSLVCQETCGYKTKIILVYIGIISDKAAGQGNASLMVVRHAVVTLKKQR